MPTTNDVRGRHDRALRDLEAFVAAVGPADLSRRTPCALWDLRALLGHQIGQHHGFAAAVTDGDAPREAFRPRPPATDQRELADSWSASVHAVRAAFAAADLERPVRLVEISADRFFPVRVAIGLQFLDTCVHAWDVATSLGRAYRPADDLLPAVWAIARQVPTGEASRRPGAQFGPVVRLRDDLPGGTADGVSGGDDARPADPWTAALALLGRDPARVPSQT